MSSKRTKSRFFCLESNFPRRFQSLKATAMTDKTAQRVPYQQLEPVRDRSDHREVGRVTGNHGGISYIGNQFI